jgi:hypothetical protein
MKILMSMILALLVVTPSAFARKGGGDKPICTGNEPARKGAPYTENESYGLKIAAFQAATAQYELEHPEGADYARISSDLIARNCFVHEDCSTGDERFVGACLRYEWVGTNGSCKITTLVAIPTPPARPSLSCEDVTCPANFQCELENSTGAIGCVEQRTCRQGR